MFPFCLTAPAGEWRVNKYLYTLTYHMTKRGSAPFTYWHQLWLLVLTRHVSITLISIISMVAYATTVRSTNIYHRTQQTNNTLSK